MKYRADGKVYDTIHDVVAAVHHHQGSHIEHFDDVFEEDARLLLEENARSKREEEIKVELEKIAQIKLQEDLKRAAFEELQKSLAKPVIKKTIFSQLKTMIAIK